MFLTQVRAFGCWSGFLWSSLSPVWAQPGCLKGMMSHFFNAWVTQTHQFKDQMLILESRVFIRLTVLCLWQMSVGSRAENNTCKCSFLVFNLIWKLESWCAWTLTAWSVSQTNNYPAFGLSCRSLDRSLRSSLLLFFLTALLLLSVTTQCVCNYLLNCVPAGKILEPVCYTNISGGLRPWFVRWIECFLSLCSPSWKLILGSH